MAGLYSAREEATMQLRGYREAALTIAAASAAAMVYVGFYQSRIVRHLWCPVFRRGCETVADAAFAKLFGMPDGYIAAVLYGAIVLLALAPGRGARRRPMGEGLDHGAARKELEAL